MVRVTLGDIIEAISFLKDSNGSKKSQIIDYLKCKMGEPPQNASFLIKKAIILGVRTGLIREIGGRFKLELSGNDYKAYKYFKKVKAVGGFDTIIQPSHRPKPNPRNSAIEIFKNGSKMKSPAKKTPKRSKSNSEYEHKNRKRNASKSKSRSNYANKRRNTTKSKTRSNYELTTTDDSSSSSLPTNNSRTCSPSRSRSRKRILRGRLHHAEREVSKSATTSSSDDEQSTSSEESQKCSTSKRRLVVHSKRRSKKPMKRSKSEYARPRRHSRHNH